jgi:hypothetical protein
MPKKTKINSKFAIPDFGLQGGATTIIMAFFVMSIILMAALTAATVMTYQIKMSLEIANSIPAFYAADAGAEKCLYQIRKLSDNQECNRNNGSISGVLDNGAGYSVDRSNKIVNSSGTFSNTKRQVELSWQ